MWSRGFIFLIGAVFVSTQIKGDTYIAELMVESNVTLDAQTIISILSSTTTLNVLDTNLQTYTVTFLQSETVAECLIIGSYTNCNCSQGYIWSNEVCYNFNCCRELTCTQNVSYIAPLCVKKVPVYINGSATMLTGIWDKTKEDMLKTAFSTLNGFEYLNVTGQRLGNTIADFEVRVSVVFQTFRLQSILDSLQNVVSVIVDTTGMVSIEAPDKVCYQSSPVLNCTFQEPTDTSGWNKSTTYDRFVLNNGSVVKLLYCNSPNMSCLSVRLDKVTSAWEGTYECGFTKGSVRHTARAWLEVARLPDNILMSINPLTGDCTNKLPTESITVNVYASILNTSNSYTVTWIYKQSTQNVIPTISGASLNYSYAAQISCTQITEAQTVNINFQNEMKQNKPASVTIPVIYDGKMFCKEETLNGDLWPKTPSGDTVVNNTCPANRVGYKTRTCTLGTEKWGNVTTFCVNAELNKISNAAESFLQGLGATEDVALDIFRGLQNNTAIQTVSSNSVADISASINILDKMKQASMNVPLGEKVIPSFINAASNILNNTWNPGNSSLLYKMSANYLQSLEGLVKNININTSGNSSDYYAPNIDLKYCSGSNCSVNAFDIGVNLNMSSGIMKTVAVKNLMDKLNNTFKAQEKTSLLVSTTLENRSDTNSSIVIEMQFTNAVAKNQTPYCVYWNTITEDWDDEGCIKKINDKNGTICECTHLTSFSVLMSRGNDVPDLNLDIITYIGLGVSICSLVIFLLIEFLVWSAVIKTKLSHYRHTAMINIAFFLLLADISFLASINPQNLPDSMCLIFTICKHLFYLVMFSWMLCLSVMLVHQLIFVFSPLRKKVFFFFSSIVGYIFPIFIVGSSYVYYKYTDQCYYDPDTCWLVYKKLLVGSLHSFLLPVGTILFTNLFSMAVVILTLMKSSGNDSSKTDEKETARNIIKVILFLTPVFGVTWSIGFCLVIINREYSVYRVFQYIFTIINSFQGLFILLIGCFSEQKVKDELFRIIKGKKGTSNSTKNMTSTTYTKDK